MEYLSSKSSSLILVPFIYLLSFKMSNLPSNQFLSSSSSASASSTSSSTSSNVINNQNLMHVKFHVNKFQENLLSKRLKQLNVEEMKQRLKHQRASNDLIFFLRECQQSTGYLSKMKPKILKKVPDTSGQIEEIKLNENSSLNVNGNNKLEKQTKIRDKLDRQFTSSMDFNSCKELTISNQSTTKVGLIRPSTASKYRSSSNAQKIQNPNILPFNNKKIEKPSNNQSNQSNDVIEILPLSSFKTNTTKRTDSLTESRLEMFNRNNNNNNTTRPRIIKSAITRELPLFYQALTNSINSNTPISIISHSSTSSHINSSSSKSTTPTRSSSSTNSNSNESLNEIGKEEIKEIKETFKKIQANISNNNNNNRLMRKSTSSSNYSDFSTVSNLDWFTSTTNFELEFSDALKKINNFTTTNKRMNGISNNLNTKKLDKIELKQSNDGSEFCSKSLNFLLKSTNQLTTQLLNNSGTNSLIKDDDTTLNDFKISTNAGNNNNNNNKSLDKLSLRKSVYHPHRHQYQELFPLKVRMSRSLIRKKQLEIMNEYKQLNTLELINSLRQIQVNLDNKVKQFAKKATQDAL